MKPKIIVASSLVPLAYVGLYFVLMRPGASVDFDRYEVVAPTYFAFSEFHRDPSAEVPVYVPESSWLNSLFYPLDRLFHSEEYRNIAQQNDEAARWRESRDRK